jgi:hypothetical protein
VRAFWRDAIGWSLLLGGLCAHAQTQGIYTCIDGKGRRLTADRPIIECIDREQSELTPSGTVKRKLAASLTAEERALEEEKALKELEERNRLVEEKKRDRALLARYPDSATHDKERKTSIAVVDEAIVSARKAIDLLISQRKQVDTELEFYARDPSKAPLKLKRQIGQNQESIEAQKRFISNQESEKQRINSRFDEELVRLKVLWAERAPPSPAKVPAAKK